MTVAELIEYLQGIEDQNAKVYAWQDNVVDWGYYEIAKNDFFYRTSMNRLEIG